MDRIGYVFLAEIDVDKWKKEANEIHHKYRIVEENDDQVLGLVWDDASGATSHPSAVKTARAEQIEYLRGMMLYTKVPIE